MNRRALPQLTAALGVAPAAPVAVKGVYCGASFEEMMDTCDRLDLSSGHWELDETEGYYFFEGDLLDEP